MTAGDWLQTIAGLALVGIVGADLFQTVLHPSARGSLSTRVFRALWALFHSLPSRALRLAGPLGFVFVILTWTSLMAAGWALVYLPHLPSGFQYDSGVPARAGFPEALYLSFTAMTTVGFGDVVAQAPLLRLAIVVEAMLGFALLSAAISWVLSIYPALARRRALASRIAALLADEPHDRLADGNTPQTLALVLHDLVAELARVRVDLVQYPATYYFTAPRSEFDLPHVLRRLRTALCTGEPQAEARHAAVLLVTAIDDLARQLGDSRRRVSGENAEDLLRSYVEDHRAT